MVFKQFTHAANTTVSKVIDIIVFTDAVHEVHIIREERDHIGNRDAADIGHVQIRADDVDDAIGFFVVSVDFDNINRAISVDIFIHVQFLRTSAAFEEFGIAKGLDVFFG